MVSDYLGWVASAVTMIAAMMTAANLGSRVTGWGFVVFSVGSLCWAAVGAFSGQTSLAITNGFLLLVNVVGVWRWLVWQARHEKGGAFAAARSRRHRQVPTLFSAGWMIGAEVSDPDGLTVGVVVDAMIDCETKQFSYLVIGQGGLVGAGEKLYAIEPRHFRILDDTIECLLSSKDLDAMAPIVEDAWPPKAPNFRAAASGS